MGLRKSWVAAGRRSRLLGARRANRRQRVTKRDETGRTVTGLRSGDCGTPVLGNGNPGRPVRTFLWCCATIYLFVDTKAGPRWRSSADC